MTVREIQQHLTEMYGAEILPTLISTVTDGVMDEVKQWQSRPLDAVYPVCTRLLSVPKFVTLAAFVPKRLKPSIHTIVQLCIVHMVRNSLNYVGWRNKRKEVAADLRLIHGAATIDEVEQLYPPLKINEIWLICSLEQQ